MKKHRTHDDTGGHPADGLPGEDARTETGGGDGGDKTASSAGTPPEPAPEEAAETVPAEVHEELNGKYLRLMAEFDNFRKRTVREKSELALEATGELVRELIPILDNLDRATEHRNDRTTLEEYVKGIALIEDQIRAILAGAGLEVIETVGLPFDPEIHEAVMQMESEEHESGTITAEVEKGYLLRGRIIRHPKVIVAK